MSSTLTELMAIDCEKVSAVIVDFLRKKVAGEKREGIVLGLSGGIDSAVAAFLAVRAVDPTSVYALHLFDRQSDKKFRQYAQRLATMLGINFEVRDITASMKALGAYKPFIMRIPSHASFILIRLSATLVRSMSYFLTLRQRAQHTGSVSPARRERIEWSFNMRHIERRRLLEEFAREKNLLLIGAANRSESFVGWFVKDGVDDIPLEVILGLYKTQVRQLAYCLQVPEEVIKVVPSPDMLRGVTDESAIGHSYEAIDKVAYVIEHGLSQDVALNEGISHKEFERIKRLNELSAWKRTNRHEFPVF